MNKFVSFGEILFDKVVINDKLMSSKLGGAPLNVASMVAKFDNCESFIYSILPTKNTNNEKEFEEIQKNLILENIKKDFLIYKDNLNIAYSLAKVDEKTGEREFEFNLDDASFLSFEEKDLDYIKTHLPSVFYLGTISFLSINNYSVIFSFLDYLKKNNVIIAFDPNYRENLFYRDDWKLLSKEILKFASILKIGKEELEVLFSNNDTILSLKTLNILYPNLRYIVVTDGKNKTILDIVNEEKGYLISPLKVKEDEIKDAIGCGDSFFGGFLGYLLSKKDLNSLNDLFFEDLDLINAVKIASICGALTIKNVGALPMPNIEKIKKEIENKNINLNEIDVDSISLKYDIKEERNEG